MKSIKNAKPIAHIERIEQQNFQMNLMPELSSKADWKPGMKLAMRS